MPGSHASTDFTIVRNILRKEMTKEIINIHKQNVKRENEKNQNDSMNNKNKNNSNKIGNNNNGDKDSNINRKNSINATLNTI